LPSGVDAQRSCVILGYFLSGRKSPAISRPPAIGTFIDFVESTSGKLIPVNEDGIEKSSSQGYHKKGSERGKDDKDKFHMKNNDSSTVRSPEEAQCMKRKSVLEWYFILRTNHHWTIFQAIRYALWLAR
jgi:hypothetical protein